MDQLVENHPDIVKRETIAQTIVSRIQSEMQMMRILAATQKLGHADNHRAGQV